MVVRELKRLRVVLVFFYLLTAGSNAQSQHSPTPSPTITPWSTVSPTPTESPTTHGFQSPSPTATPTPTQSPSPTTSPPACANSGFQCPAEGCADECMDIIEDTAMEHACPTDSGCEVETFNSEYLDQLQYISTETSDSTDSVRWDIESCANYPFPDNCTIIRGTRVAAQRLRCWSEESDQFLARCAMITAGGILEPCAMSAAQISAAATACPDGTPSERIDCFLEAVRNGLTGTNGECRNYAKCLHNVLRAAGFDRDLAAGDFTFSGEGHVWNEIRVDNDCNGIYDEHIVSDSINNVAYRCPIEERTSCSCSCYSGDTPQASDGACYDDSSGLELGPCCPRTPVRAPHCPTPTPTPTPTATPTTSPTDSPSPMPSAECASCRCHNGDSPRAYGRYCYDDSTGESLGPCCEDIE